MRKQYKVERKESTRFSLHEFCKMAWQMSAKEDWHYIDFKIHFANELKALYLKTGIPLLANKLHYSDVFISTSDYLQQFEPSAKGVENAVFYSIKELTDTLKVDRSELVDTLVKLGFETTYLREINSEYSNLGVWVTQNDLPF